MLDLSLIMIIEILILATYACGVLIEKNIPLGIKLKNENTYCWIKFIVFSMARFLLQKNFQVIGVDNINNYYSKNLKFSRLKELKKNKKFRFYKIDCSSNKLINNLRNEKSINLIIHLAAEVGMRNSYLKPKIYYENNIKSFLIF